MIGRTIIFAARALVIGTLGFAALVFTLWQHGLITLPVLGQ